MSLPLLHLEASPRSTRSHSRQIGAEFLAAWRGAHPGAPVITRDLTLAPPPFVSEPWVEGAFTPPAGHSEPAREAIQVSDGYVQELLSAGELLITTPMYNLSIPAVLKAWIDQVVRVGRTVSMGGGGFVGLVTGRKVTVVVASGSDFRPGTPAAGFNFVEPYLRAILGFIGLTDVTFVYVHSQNHGNPAGPQATADAQAAARQLAAA